MRIYFQILFILLILLPACTNKRENRLKEYIGEVYEYGTPEFNDKSEELTINLDDAISAYEEYMVYEKK